MVQGDRRQRSNERPNRRIALIWLVLAAIFCAVGLQRIVYGQFPDPDDALRLVQVRDLLGGQGWFDLHQYRIDPASDGTLMHWSRLVDVPIALAILLLTPILGAASAEAVALIAVPLLTLGAILFLIGRLAWRLFDVDVAGFACLSLGLLAPLVFQLQPMRIDHHGWQIFWLAVALWAITGRTAQKRGTIAGLAMALGVTISLEILPMAAAFGAVLALRWLDDRDQRWWLISYMLGLALGLLAAFLATRGLVDLAQHCDAVSPAHLGFFITTATGVAALAASPPLPRPALIVAFTLIGAVGILLFAFLSPGCVASPFAQLDPEVHAFWYSNVLEGQPLWKQDLTSAIPVLVQLLVALFVVTVLRGNSRDWQRVYWGEYAFLLAASIALSLFVWRSAAFAALLSAIPLGWLAARLLQQMRNQVQLSRKLLSVLIIVLVLLPATPVRLWQNLASQPKPESEKELSTVRESACDIREQAALLGQLSTGTIFAPLDIGPAILLESDHSVVATSHHRANLAMRDVIQAFRGSPDVARARIIAHDADFVAICTDLYEINLYAEAGEDSFAQQLIVGEHPDWLDPVELGAPTEFKVWRVRD